MGITLKNISSATVALSYPDIRFNRSLVPGRSIPLTQEQYDELAFDPGIRNLIETGYIKVEGIEEETQAIESSHALEATEIIKMINDKDYAAFTKFIPTASIAERETVIQYLVANNITDNAFAALIKKYCDVDIIQAISIKHQAEEK